VTALPDRVPLPDGRVLTVRRIHDVWRVGNRWWRGDPPTLHLLVDAVPHDAVPHDAPARGGDVEGAGDVDALTLELRRDDAPDAPWRPERTWD
jgi:hypothetical protein